MNRPVALVVKQAISAPIRRAIATEAPLNQKYADISKIKAKQREFQIDDGVPVYLKNGFSDKLLFGATMGLCVAGLGYSVNLIYRMAQPPQN